jgi:hypothetical protein
VTALSPLILGKVKPLRKTKADSLCLSVCTSFIYTTTTIHRGWPLLSPTQGHKGIPFRYTSWTPHSHSRKPNSTLPTRPTLFSRSVHFEHISVFTYHTYQLGIDIHQRSILFCLRPFSVLVNNTRIHIGSPRSRLHDQVYAPGLGKEVYTLQPSNQQSPKDQAQSSSLTVSRRILPHLYPYV